MSTFNSEYRHTPNTSVKDRILYYSLVHSDFHRRMSTITYILWWRSKREEPAKRRLVVPAKSFVLMGVSQLCQSYASGRERESSTASNKNVTNLTKTFAPVQIGDTVRIQVPDVDRGCVDNRNVFAVVVGMEDSDFYKLANENGTLKQLYTSNQFVICKEKLLSIAEIYFQEMSLREAAAANLRSGGQGYTSCHCKGSVPQINAVVKSIADELKLVVPDNAKVLDLRELIQESEIYKNDKETYQAIVDCVLEEINDRRNEDENRRNENENRLEIEKIKLSQLEKELEIAKLHNQSGKSLPLQNENQLITTECNIETGQPNSSKVSSQPARRCVRGPGGSNCVVPPQGENEENKSFVATSFLKNKTRTVLLSSVQCFLRDKYGLLHEVRALLDVGSQSHFITKDCADRLQLKNEKINLLVSCLNESTMTINGGVTTSIFNGDLSFKKELNLLVVRRITDLTPSKIINVSLDMPNEIKLADYKFNIPGKIDVLLGAEIFYELLRPGQIYCGDSRLLLQNTVFGYVVSGSVGDEVRDNNIHCGLIRDGDLNTTLRSFWELESIGVKNENCCSEEDVSFEMFKQRVHFKNGRYEVELPWKRDSNELSDNFSLAKRRLGSLMRKMQRDKVLYSEYCKVLKNYLDEGIIEKVTNPFIPTNNPVFYLPHQVIIKNESLTTKLRLVFDASAHAENQLSLNDCLFHGVNLNPNILDLLISFRSNKIAVLADVEKAFLQISLAPKDRDVVRFLIDDGEKMVCRCTDLIEFFWRERVSVSFGCND
ncbi:integrase catalytic domain-containing protein [Trichonephila clavipes]|uniref:Integrase catalytic domain-containing protein n=1 Tax=Trichonephila clavipes TaxID=2585209 RepID=A0A8X7BIW3_TRICX|nr:integrase catalytic domain-containing protein [Trichonephila clavipes]